AVIRKSFLSFSNDRFGFNCIDKESFVFTCASRGKHTDSGAMQTNSKSAIWVKRYFISILNFVSIQYLPLGAVY
ncbi:hypothetical protein, partial [uncultured Prevotella sp.]|uniref:hypothetical protein n=1 Tax=uncultured Prevotella sp. TaxID=159272 RepID=UPI00266EC787